MRLFISNTITVSCSPDILFVVLRERISIWLAWGKFLGQFFTTALQSEDKNDFTQTQVVWTWKYVELSSCWLFDFPYSHTATHSLSSSSGFFCTWVSFLLWCFLTKKIVNMITRMAMKRTNTPITMTIMESFFFSEAFRIGAVKLYP